MPFSPLSVGDKTRSLYIIDPHKSRNWLVISSRGRKKWQVEWHNRGECVVVYYGVLTSEGSLCYSEEYPSMYCCSYATCVCIGSIGGLWLVPVVGNWKSNRSASHQLWPITFALTTLSLLLTYRSQLGAVEEHWLSDARVQGSRFKSRLLGFCTLIAIDSYF